MSRYAAFSLFLAALVCLSGCATAGSASSDAAESAPSAPEPIQSTQAPQAATPQAVAVRAGASAIFSIENTDGADNGVARLIALMERGGTPFYQTDGTPRGIIAANDVVLLEINCQWAERGGTNTDLIKSVIDAVLAHPDGFRGEIVIADNGQAQYGSEGGGGSLDWARANSLTRDQSAQDVINAFAARGEKVSGVLWDDFTAVRVGEFSTGDMADGFVVEDEIRPTGLEISYAKFTTAFGTRVSFREGVWNGSSYDPARLKVINMPVLKSHGLYQVTGAVKSYMGTTSDKLTDRRAHNSIGAGGMGTQMAHTRFPALNIIDMIWTGPERGPGVPFARAVETQRIAASVDPVALDFWAAKYVLMPQAETLPGGRAAAMDPAGTAPGTFGHWLRLSMDELLAAGYSVTMDEANMAVITEEDIASAALPAALLSGSLTVTFDYTRQSGSASNQFAVWIEDAGGKLVKTLYATRFTADGGWEFREQSLPVWTERFGIARRGDAEIDAVTGPTPREGTLVYTWDGSGEAGLPLPAGEYRVMVEGSLRWENQVLYTCDIALGGDAKDAQAQVSYTGGSHAEHGMLGPVTVSWEPN